MNARIVLRNQLLASSPPRRYSRSAYPELPLGAVSTLEDQDSSPTQTCRDFDAGERDSDRAAETRAYCSLAQSRERSATARVEAEQRVRLFQRYAGFFESAADGMVVIDRSGRVLFTNPRAREITGATESDLAGASFESLLGRGQSEIAARLMRGFEAGVYPRGVDLRLAERNGRSLIANVSFSSVLREDDAVLFTFGRDGRAHTAVELKQTKDFLESVIDSSVDAMIGGFDGTVRCVQPSRSGCVGYVQTDVIGKLNVRSCIRPAWPGSDATDSRSERSGYGRLEDFRVDMLGADGRSVPVMLSASFVVENGRPVGSLGIFTDLRERVRIQGELERAHEELREREKHALIAELAGAAAHELNQPLTSVIGYAQLLGRQFESDPVARKRAQIIVSEAQRMAEIVRKVGSITKTRRRARRRGTHSDLERASDGDAGKAADDAVARRLRHHPLPGPALASEAREIKASSPLCVARRNEPPTIRGVTSCSPRARAPVEVSPASWPSTSSTG